MYIQRACRVGNKSEVIEYSQVICCLHNLDDFYGKHKEHKSFQAKSNDRVQNIVDQMFVKNSQSSFCFKLKGTTKSKILINLLSYTKIF